MKSQKISQTTFDIGKGINNIDDPVALGSISTSDFAADEAKRVRVLTRAENVDIDNNGLARRRAGRTVKFLNEKMHSFFVSPKDSNIAYFVLDGSLYRMFPDYSYVMVAFLASDKRLSYIAFNGELVVSNGAIIGWLDGSVLAQFAPVLGQFEAAFPASTYLEFFNGCLVGAKDNIITVSKPYNAEVVDARLCSFPLDSNIRMLAAVEDGLWVSTDTTLGFISGAGSDEFSYQTYGGNIPPDGCFGKRSIFKDTEEEKIVYWASDGFYEGRKNGKIINVSQDNVRLPVAAKGRCFFRAVNGVEQYIANLFDAEDNNIYVPLATELNSKEVS
jgi:hypothetical protein